jgi:hypothetical protein
MDTYLGYPQPDQWINGTSKPPSPASFPASFPPCQAAKDPGRTAKAWPLGPVCQNHGVGTEPLRTKETVKHIKSMAISGT